MTLWPEIIVALFSFLLHFVWEFVQAPTYSDMVTMNHWDGIKLCLSATFGDVGFALTAYWIVAVIARKRRWVMEPMARDVAIFLAVGLVLTISFEFYYTEISLRWTYSDLMPLVPPLGTGLSPLVQWVVVPSLVVWLTRRHLIGSETVRALRGEQATLEKSAD